LVKIIILFLRGPEQYQDTKPAPDTLGTFEGVFTPSVLTILGIILFLRLGFVVGSAGLKGALPILLLANGISVLTSLSLSAISTNIRVKGGGVYYLISRTLGREFGGAIGIVLFLAQSISIAFYCIGFGEALAVIVSADNVKLFSQLVAAADAATDSRKTALEDEKAAETSAKAEDAAQEAEASGAQLPDTKKDSSLVRDKSSAA
jgi:amino acid permease-like protein